VLLVQRLRERERHARGEAEAPVCLALQAGEIEEQRRDLRRRLRLLGGDAFLALAGGDDLRCIAGLPEPLRPALRILVVPLEIRVEPASRVLARFRLEARMPGGRKASADVVLIDGETTAVTLSFP